MPSSAAQATLPIPTIPTADLAATQSLESVLRSLGLAHAASILDAACAKAIARNDPVVGQNSIAAVEPGRIMTPYRGRVVGGG